MFERGVALRIPFFGSCACHLQLYLGEDIDRMSFVSLGSSRNSWRDEGVIGSDRSDKDTENQR